MAIMDPYQERGVNRGGVRFSVQCSRSDHPKIFQNLVFDNVVPRASEIKGSDREARQGWLDLQLEL